MGLYRGDQISDNQCANTNSHRTWLWLANWRIGCQKLTAEFTGVRQIYTNPSRTLTRTKLNKRAAMIRISQATKVQVQWATPPKSELHTAYCARSAWTNSRKLLDVLSLSCQRGWESFACRFQATNHPWLKRTLWASSSSIYPHSDWGDPTAGPAVLFPCTPTNMVICPNTGFDFLEESYEIPSGN